MSVVLHMSQVIHINCTGRIGQEGAASPCLEHGNGVSSWRQMVAGPSPMVPGWTQPERTTWSIHLQNVSCLKCNTFPKWWIKLTLLNDLTQFLLGLVVSCCLQCYFVYSLHVLCCVINSLSETIRYCTWKWVLLFRLKQTAVYSATRMQLDTNIIYIIYTHAEYTHPFKCCPRCISEP